MLQSRMISHFYESANNQLDQLALCETTIALMMSLQHIWGRLQFFYMQDEVRTHLEATVETFQQAQLEFRRTIEKMRVETRVLDSCAQASMQPRLEKLLYSFNTCEYALIGWFEAKRQSFPRFYFLSDEEIARILSDGPISPKHITEYLHRIMAGAHALIYATRLTASGNEVFFYVCMVWHLRMNFCVHALMYLTRLIATANQVFFNVCVYVGACAYVYIYAYMDALCMPQMHVHIHKYTHTHTHDERRCLASNLAMTRYCISKKKLDLSITAVHTWTFGLLMSSRGRARPSRRACSLLCSENTISMRKRQVRT